LDAESEITCRPTPTIGHGEGEPIKTPVSFFFLKKKIEKDYFK
jgi:hypothetical protein